MKEKLTQVVANVPVSFGEKWDKFCEIKNENHDGVRKITKKELMYEALVEYMENHPN